MERPGIINLLGIRSGMCQNGTLHLMAYGDCLLVTSFYLDDQHFSDMLAYDTIRPLCYGDSLCTAKIDYVNFILH